jgi:hypothetical protein
MSIERVVGWFRSQWSGRAERKPQKPDAQHYGDWVLMQVCRFCRWTMPTTPEVCPRCGERWREGEKVVARPIYKWGPSCGSVPGIRYVSGYELKKENEK